MPAACTDPEALFVGLMPCGDFFFPFLDRYAQFGTVFEVGRGLGPGMLQTRSAAFTNQVSTSALRLHLVEAGVPVPVVATSTDHLPWQVVQTAALPVARGAIDVTCTCVYRDARTLLVRFVLTNRSDQPVEVQPQWIGQVNGDQHRRPGRDEERRHGLLDHPLREAWCEPGPHQVLGGLADPTAILPQPRLRVRCRPADGLRPSVGPLPLWLDRDAGGPARSARSPLHYVFDGGMWRLPPGASRETLFTIEQTVATHADRDPAWPEADPATIAFDAEVERARRDFLARVGLDRPPRTAGPASQRKAWRARWALLRSGFQATGGAGEEFRDWIASTCVASNSGFTRVFFWDSLFTAAALADVAPEAAKGAIRAAFARQDPRTGQCPEHSYDYHVPGRNVVGAPQAPVGTWALERYLACRPDDVAFARELLPTLEANHRYWTTMGDRDGDGLAEWTWAGQTADNSPLFDQHNPDGRIGWLPPIASVQLNAFLYRDAIALARLHDAHGDPATAARHRAAAAARQEALFRHCYVPAERRFWDFDHATGRHTRVRTFYMFWPLWAGMDVPAETARELIEDVLLDPRQFFGPVPFPSVAYDEHTYDPEGYWRGKAWPHIAYWLVEMLRERGYAEAADEAVRRLLAVWLREPGFPENMRSDIQVFEAQKTQDYNWGISMAYLLLTRCRPRSSTARPCGSMSI